MYIYICRYTQFLRISCVFCKLSMLRKLQDEAETAMFPDDMPMLGAQSSFVSA